MPSGYRSRLIRRSDSFCNKQRKKDVLHFQWPDQTELIFLEPDWFHCLRGTSIGGCLLRAIHATDPAIGSLNVKHWAQAKCPALNTIFDSIFRHKRLGTPSSQEFSWLIERLKSSSSTLWELFDSIGCCSCKPLNSVWQADGFRKTSFTSLETREMLPSTTSSIVQF